MSSTGRFANHSLQWFRTSSYAFNLLHPGSLFSCDLIIRPCSLLQSHSFNFILFFPRFVAVRSFVPFSLWYHFFGICIVWTLIQEGIISTILLFLLEYKTIYTLLSSRSSSSFECTFLRFLFTFWVLFLSSVRHSQFISSQATVFVFWLQNSVGFLCVHIHGSSAMASVFSLGSAVGRGTIEVCAESSLCWCVHCFNCFSFSMLCILLEFIFF